MSNRVTTVKKHKKEDEKSDSAVLDEFVNEEFERRLGKLEERFRSGSPEEKLRQVYEQTLFARRAKQVLDKKPEPKQNLYLTDYEFLTNCYNYLTQTKDEGFCLVTGPEIDGRIYTLSRRIEPKMKRQGPAGAEPDLGSLNRLLEKIDEGYGEHLSGYFHSHPGRGKGSTIPSSIDFDTQEKLERGGYPVVGCIFSRDGYLRFYSDERDFHLNLSGNGGEQVDRRIFKLGESKVSRVT